MKIAPKKLIHLPSFRTSPAPAAPDVPAAYAAHVARRRGAAAPQRGPGGAHVRGAEVEAQLTLEVEKVKT